MGGGDAAVREGGDCAVKLPQSTERKKKKKNNDVWSHQ
jgi:hypothetical protein